MLYQIGPLSLDTMPFAPDSFSTNAGADLAVKAVMGGRQRREYMGEADETVSISGQLLPTKLGGLGELELAKSLARSGTQVPIVRGDGMAMGWYAIEKVTDQHSDLTRHGVGFVVRYTLSLVRVDPGAGAAAGDAQGLIGMMLNLFEVF